MAEIGPLCGDPPPPTEDFFLEIPRIHPDLSRVG